MERENFFLLKNKLAELFEKGLENQVFSGAAIGIYIRDKYKKNNVFTRGYGYTEGIYKSCPVSINSLYDLASLTKPLVTVLTLLILMERGRIKLSSSLEQLLPASKIPKDKKGIYLWQLMSHSSGFSAHHPYFTKLLSYDPKKRKKEVIAKILQEPLKYIPGTNHCYSDLGFIVLGEVVEQLTGQSLVTFWRRNIAEPLGIESLFHCYGEVVENKERFLATEVCPWTNRLLKGEVHDDNCRVIGSLCGHTGLFGTIEGVLILTSFLSKIWQGDGVKQLFSKKLFNQITERVGKSTWSYGFDTPSKLYSSSGKFFGQKSIGHLGFTGTSFWIDLERGITVVLLSNRVHPFRSNEAIKRFRPKVHNLIMEEIAGC